MSSLLVREGWKKQAGPEGSVGSHPSWPELGSRQDPTTGLLLVPEAKKMYRVITPPVWKKNL